MKNYLDEFSPLAGRGAGSRLILKLEKIAASSPKKLAKAIDMAISDVVSDCDEIPQAAVTKIDAYMSSVGAASLSELRIECSRRLRAILRQSEIKDEFDYYFIKDIIDSGASDPESAVSLRLQELSLRYVESKPG
ncbi:hypothetical protein [Silanimonas sp.]|uniref:hypothetical protein n=1 Tax=Silanimonas sp. TaxID=1929290 RepID=UPI0037C8BA29